MRHTHTIRRFFYVTVTATGLLAAAGCRNTPRQHSTEYRTPTAACMPLSDADSALGRMEVRTYVSESGMPQKYRLTIRSREHSGDGHFSLSVTTRLAAGECRVDSCSGRRLTLRGMAGDNNATVWQLIAADKDETIHLLRRNDETLVLLNERLEKSSPEIRLHLTSEGPALHAQ